MERLGQSLRRYLDKHPGPTVEVPVIYSDFPIPKKHEKINHREFWRIFLKKLRPSQCFFTYHRSGILDAARELGYTITTREMKDGRLGVWLLKKKDEVWNANLPTQNSSTDSSKQAS